jgi:hypothetical protein
MGAEYFSEVVEGNTAKEAFNNAVEEAQFEYGHGGYSGTIAEKTSFTMARDSVMDQEDAEIIAERLSETKYSDKWGPAGCIPLKDGKWLFFGWASS